MKKLFLLIFILFLFTAISSFLFYRYKLSGICRTNCSLQVFVVPQGATINSILEKLEKEKIIRNSFVAKIYLRLTNFKGQIQAGDFKLNPRENFPTLLTTLQKGSLDFWVTIPEGKRGEEVCEIINKARNVETRDCASNPQGRASLYKQNEGYLFPDTYLIPKNASDENVVQIMKNNFYAKMKSGFASDCRDVACNVSTTGNGNGKISLGDLIILASLVEREAKNDMERPIIAGIIYKRWKADWPLQVDATVQYAVGNSAEWWKKALTFDDLKVDSPYNTYLIKGLTPAPICNPGLAAIEAVVNQKLTDYWFYSTGKDGITCYAKTLEEHNKNVTTNLIEK